MHSWNKELRIQTMDVQNDFINNKKKSIVTNLICTTFAKKAQNTLNYALTVMTVV